MKEEHEPQDWKEGRRLRAWELWQQGWKQKDIATALGVSKGAVSQWLTRAKVEGREGLPGGKFLSVGRRISTSAALLVPRRSFIFMTLLMTFL